MKQPAADSAFSIELFAYPWDILDRGVEAFADECRALGVTRLHVTTVYHSGKFLLPRRSRERVYFPQPGAIYVPIETSRFGDTGPVRSPIADTGWLDQLAAAGLPLSAWTVFHHSSRLGAKRPEQTVHNLFGDAYPYALCPSHPANREYAVELARSLAEVGCFDSLDLETIGYLGYFHDHHHEVTAVPLGPMERFLLSLCFCDACRGAAKGDGIDVSPLVKRLEAVLSRKLRADDACSRNPESMEQLASLIAQVPELQQLIGLRMRMVTSLVREIAAAAKGVKLSVFTSSFVGSPSNIWMEGVSLEQLRGVVDCFQLLAYTSDTDLVNDDLLFCLSQVRGPEQVNLTLNLGLPITPSVGYAAAKLSFAAAQGVRRFSFFNYGFLGEGRLDWIRQLAAGL